MTLNLGVRWYPIKVDLWKRRACQDHFFLSWSDHSFKRNHVKVSSLLLQKSWEKASPFPLLCLSWGGCLDTWACPRSISSCPSKASGRGRAQQVCTGQVFILASPCWPRLPLHPESTLLRYTNVFSVVLIRQFSHKVSGYPSRSTEIIFMQKMFLFLQCRQKYTLLYFLKLLKTEVVSGNHPVLSGELSWGGDAAIKFPPWLSKLVHFHEQSSGDMQSFNKINESTGSSFSWPGRQQKCFHSNHLKSCQMLQNCFVLRLPHATSDVRC